MDRSLMYLVLFGLLLTGCASPAEKGMMQHSGTDSGMMDHGADSSGSPRADQNEVQGLPLATPMRTISFSDGEKFDLSAFEVNQVVDGTPSRMLSFNGMIPGPLLSVKQGDTIFINFTNNIEETTSIHWHGVRVKNKYDGAAHLTQEPVEAGSSFMYELTFPDAGIYWYHPHEREGPQLDRGMYGAILVEPAEAGYYRPADRQEVLLVDDVLISSNGVAPYPPSGSNYALMGRFGNRMLVNGHDRYSLTVGIGETIRFFIVNTANTRVFNLSIPGQSLRLVGGDSGLMEKPELRDSVVLGPGERAIVETSFGSDGEFKILHINPFASYELVKINVVAQGQRKESSLAQGTGHQETKQSVEPFKKFLNGAPDIVLNLTVWQEPALMAGHHHATPKLGKGGIEWEDSMPMMNAMSTTKNTRWILQDAFSGKEGKNLSYTVRVGDQRKIRLFNDPSSAHPMQHPIHLHGQRFLVLEQDGVRKDNLVWKDTVLVPTGSTVDILVDFTNPGDWMIHCHISEHLEAGMMGTIRVEP